MALVLLAPIAAQEPAPVSRYDKIEAMVPMRDGTRLMTVVYVPKFGDPAVRRPILLERTPYSAGPYGPTAQKRHRNRFLQDAGYVFVYQDVRGKYLSEGEFVNVRPILPKGKKGTDEATDTYDTVEWLVKNVPNNNGKVGMWGISYPGFYAGAGAVDSHPALAASSPQAPVSDWWIGDDFHHGGAFFLEDAFNFLSGFGAVRPTPSAAVSGIRISKPNGPVEFFLNGGSAKDLDDKYFQGRIPFWRDMIAHPDYDAFWQARSLPKTTRNVGAAMLEVGGWFDAEDCWGALNLYAANERKAKNNFLVMGPWFHGMWAGRGSGSSFHDLDFGQDTQRSYQELVEFPFFERYLNGKDVAAPAEATVFETGVNQWRRYSKWPPNPKGLAMWLTGGRLSDRPIPASPVSYANDPADPTPYTIPVPARRNREYMISDQKAFEGRPDVATFRGPVLNETLRIGGPIDVDLTVTTTGTDADFIVKVIDEYPADTADKSPKGTPMGGYQLLLRGDVLRGRYRDSFSRPKAFVPGRPTRVRFRLNDVLHSFRPGHRVVVQVQSSWFPLVDRNPNAFVNVYTARPADYRKATIAILDRSKIILPTIDR